MLSHKVIKYRNFKTFDENSFRQDLEHTAWNILDLYDNVDDKLEIWEKLFMDTVNRHAPLVEKRVKCLQQPPWWNGDLQNACDDRHKLFYLK